MSIEKISNGYITHPPVIISSIIYFSLTSQETSQVKETQVIIRLALKIKVFYDPHQEYAFKRQVGHR
jgi:hypothetical protein